MELARNILPLVRAGYPDVVVKLIKIAEFEGREDEKALVIRLVKKAAKMDAASKLKSMQANARVIKHYRSKVTKTITETIQFAFDDYFERYQRDLSAFLNNLGWIFASRAMSFLASHLATSCMRFTSRSITKT
ncbi:exocyst complex component Sec6-domain-containing protein [Boletus edulis]|nr:exocyst complex component Sec6-domain-containing protein [Boletus edulis]